MKKMICGILLGMWSLAIYAQTEVLLNVDIGDSIPAINLTDIADRPKAEVNLRELSKEKLVVLDFWATWCGSCLAAMPKLDSIAAEYAGDVEIITVTTQPKELVLGFLEKRKQRGLYVNRMPKLFDDKELAVLFPHRVIPHYVWLKDEKVIGFTEEVTREAVDKALLRGEVNLRTKTDKINEEFNMREETLLEFLQQSKSRDFMKVQNYSLLTGYVERLGTLSGYSLSRIDNSDKTKFTGINMTLENLYRVAFGKMKRFINDSSIEVRSRSIYFATRGLKGMRFLDWLVDHGVSYEVIASSEEELFEKIASDLHVAFPMFKVYTTEVIDTCLVLTEFDLKPEMQWKISKEGKGNYLADMDGVVIDNGTISGLLTALEAGVFYGVKEPLVDRTGYKGKIRIHLLGDISSLEGINGELKRYGLRLEKKEMNYDKLIIEDM